MPPAEGDRRRLAQLLGMMGSAHDGEVLNAAKLANRELRECSLTWEEILLPRSPQPDRFAEGYARGFAAGKQTCRDENDQLPWRSMVRRCLDDLDDLSAKEESFLTSLRRWRGASISPKQQRWLEDIYARVCW